MEIERFNIKPITSERFVELKPDPLGVLCWSSEVDKLELYWSSKVDKLEARNAELLGTLKGIAVVAEYQGGWGAVLDEVRAVIAKAEGGSDERTTDESP